MAKKAVPSKQASAAEAEEVKGPITAPPGVLLNLDPRLILADQEANCRYGVKDVTLDTLVQSIIEQGKVLQPLIVRPLSPPINGQQYKLVVGFRRHAAVVRLNKEGTGLTLPCQVEDGDGDALATLKTQLAENVERDNLSPMDTATAMQKLISLGVSKVEVRKVFSRPGGKTGLKMQPLSNAMLNIYLSFLDFPKAIQAKIHDGRLAVKAAYELTRQPPEKHAAILERAEKERLSEIEQEDKDDQKLLDQERKTQNATKKQDEAKVAMDATKAGLEDLKRQADVRSASVAESYKVAISLGPGKGKKAADEAHKKAEAELKELNKLIAKQTQEVSRAVGALQKAEQTTQQRAAKLKAARDAKAKKPVTAKQVTDAAAAEGGGHKPLVAAEMRSAVEGWCLAGGYEKVRAIGRTLKSCFSGELTANQAYEVLAKITGEFKEKKVKQ
jgi:ParB/RepB/Spo0J family partition protein